MGKPIQRGDKYKNSNGKVCTIIEIEGDNRVHYLHENGSTYRTSNTYVHNFWTRLHPAEESFLKAVEKDLVPKTSTKETKMQDICQYLTENFSKEVAVRFAKTAVSKYKENFLAMNDTTNRPDRIVNTPYWRNTPEGHDYWKSVHDRCSRTDKVKIDYSILEKYANESLDSKSVFIQNYAISLADTSLEDRLKVKALLMELKEPVYQMSLAFSENTVKDKKAYLGMGGYEWSIGNKSDMEGKIILTIEEFINRFGVKQEPMPEVLEEKSNTTTKITKKETFMSKVKTTVTTTLEQNKQAAIIAAQVDAGRIINKQVIKQLKPHIPMFFRGYLDTPLAPIIAANAVAMIGNHTDNEKIKKIGELMLLGAADATVQSFNLDKIIDDVLKGISLPEGILDASSDK